MHAIGVGGQAHVELVKAQPAEPVFNVTVVVGIKKEQTMTRYYVNPDPDRNSGMTQGNVVFAKRDYDIESLPERQRWPRAVTENELCNYVEGMYLSAMHDKFRQHPERKKMEVRCENKAEAEYLRQLINRRCADPTNRFEVIYYS